MGQYYKAVNLDRKEFLSSYDYGSGAKLMEHSWLENAMMNTIMQALSPGGDWQGNRLVWAGDYMDNGLFLDDIPERSNDHITLYACCQDFPDGVKAPCIKKVQHGIKDGPVPMLIFNHDTKQYVSLSYLPEEDPSDPGWHVHPLSLLTCSGNGRGGGDFRGKSDHIGIWAGHHISTGFVIPKGFGQLIPAFTERLA